MRLTAAAVTGTDVPVCATRRARRHGVLLATASVNSSTVMRAAGSTYFMCMSVRHCFLSFLRGSRAWHSRSLSSFYRSCRRPIGQSKTSRSCSPKPTSTKRSSRVLCGGEHKLSFLASHAARWHLTCSGTQTLTECRCRVAQVNYVLGQRSVELLNRSLAFDDVSMSLSQSGSDVLLTPPS